MPEGRRAGSQRDPSGGAASAFGAALPVMGRGEETNSKNLRLRAGWAGLQGPTQPAKLTRGPGLYETKAPPLHSYIRGVSCSSAKKLI